LGLTKVLNIFGLIIFQTTAGLRQIFSHVRDLNILKDGQY